MFGHRAIDHDGWRAVCPWPGPSFAEAARPVRYPDHRRHPGDARRRTLGALPRRRGLLREPRPRRRAPRQAHRADRPVVRRSGQVRGAAHRRQRPDPADDRAPADHRGADELHVLAGHRRRAAAPSPRGCSTARTASPPTSRSRPAAPRACCSCQGANTGGFTFYVKEQRLHYAHNYLGRAIYRVSCSRPAARGQPPAALRVRADRQARLRPRPGGAGTGPALRRRPARRADRHPGDRPDRVQPRRPVVRIQPRRADRDRLPVTVPVHRAAAHRSPST